MGKQWKQWQTLFYRPPKITADCDYNHEIERCLLLGRKAMTNLDSILKSRDIALLTKICSVKVMVFSSSHVWMWGFDHKGSWVSKNWHFWTVVLEKTHESPLNCKEIHPVNPKGNQSWILIGMTDDEDETIILWPPDGGTDSLEKPWCLEGLGVKGEGDDRGWDGWMASPTWWTWVWVRSGSWWWTGKPGVLQSTGSKRVGHNWATELIWTEPGREATLPRSYKESDTT